MAVVEKELKTAHVTHDIIIKTSPTILVPNFFVAYTFWSLLFGSFPQVQPKLKNCSEAKFNKTLNFTFLFENWSKQLIQEKQSRQLQSVDT